MAFNLKKELNDDMLKVLPIGYIHEKIEQARKELIKECNHHIYHKGIELYDRDIRDCLESIRRRIDEVLGGKE